jgi:hypothetical protein
MLRTARRGFLGLSALSTPAVMLAVWAGIGPGTAQAQVSSGACTTNNLLANKAPWQWQDLRGSATLITDGAVAPEGAQWDAPVAVTFDTPAGSVTYDLGAPTPIGGVYVQADANDTYKIQGSLDGTAGSFKLLTDIDMASDRGHGLRARSAQFPAVTVRYLRVGEGVGDGFYSLAEFAAYCQPPFPFPPAFRVAEAPLAAVTTRPWYKLDWWEDHASARFEMVLALFGLLVLAWGVWNQKTGKDFQVTAAGPRWTAALSILIYAAITAALLSTNWVPWWSPFIMFWLSAEFTLLVTPLPKRVSTPLRWIVATVRARKTAADKTAPAPVGTDGKAFTPAGHVRRQLLVLVGVLSFLAYFNFGAFHFGNYTHYWDTYHYYVGSKYFKEMSFDRLYDCASVADSEDPTLRRRVELRKIMNLRTNVLGSTSEILAHPELCKAPFTPERWEMFKKDIEYFRNRHGVKRWEEAQTDHGYNATPVWNIVGSFLANLAPVSDNQLWILTRIDPLFIVGMALMIWWAFGWQVLCVALAVFGTNFPSRFYWTGGAYLRWDWLFHMTAGVCFLKKRKPIVGGFLLAYSALLRVFPGFLFLGPLFVIAQQLFDRKRGPVAWKRIDPLYVKLVLGGALAVVTLVPISLVTSNGVAGYKAFLKNSEKHTSTPLTNYMGWRTVITYKEQESGRFLKTDRLEDPWKDWKDARLRTFHQRKVAYTIGVLAFVVFLFFAVRGFAAWEAAALSSLMIAVVPELTCYYYSFLIVLALLYEKKKEVGIVLLGVTAATVFIDWAPTQFLPRGFPWSYLQMPTWLDEQYTYMSVVTLLGIGYMLYEFGIVAHRIAPARAVAGAPTGTAPSSEAPAESAAEPTAASEGGAKKSAPAVRKKSRASQRRKPRK